jgi:hypothetical protein
MNPWQLKMNYYSLFRYIDTLDAATFVPLSQVPPNLSATVPPDISATFNKVDICPTYN